MPVITAKPQSKPVPPQDPVRIAKQGFKSITVDTQYNPKETIIAHIEGYSWTVTFYSQVLGRDTGAAGQGIETDPVLQQYRRINNMEIKVSTPLNTSQTEETGEMVTQGSATCYPHVIPNKGDMFVADIMDGRQGIFQITSVTRLTVMRDTAHAIDYVLVDYGTPARLNDLSRKVVQEAYFEKDFIYHGQNPVLLGQDYENYNFLRRSISGLVGLYFRRFYSVEFATMILPDQEKIIYDHFMVGLMFQLLDTRDARVLTNMRRLNIDDDKAMSALCVWDAIVRQDRNLLQEAFHTCGTVDVRHFQRSPMFEGIRYSGMDLTIYPRDAMETVDNQYTQEQKNPDEFVPTVKSVANRKAQFDAEGNSLELNCIKPAMQDGYYVFSKQFYENDRTANAQSKLELALQDFMDKKEIDYGRIRELVQASSHWNALNSFYYVPALIILIKGVIRGI